MRLSFFRFGVFRLGFASFILDAIHLILQASWPAIRGSKLGHRPPLAQLFILGEGFVALAAIAAGFEIICAENGALQGPHSRSKAALMVGAIIWGVLYTLN